MHRDDSSVADRFRDTIEVALDVTANGRLPLPPYHASPSQIHNVTIFLYSYTTGKNFTITNGTASANNASLGDLMLQEPNSTVKHVRWTWPDCLVGNGHPTEPGSARGPYNVGSRGRMSSTGAIFTDTQVGGGGQISIRQNFRLNRMDHYTVFDLPISVTNSIGDGISRPSCDSLNNPLRTPEQANMVANDVHALFAPGDSTTVEVSTDVRDGGLGPVKPGATADEGLGGSGRLGWRSASYWVCVLSVAVALVS